MRPTTSASLVYVPAEADHDALAAAARGCHACPLYRHATQTVFGEGPARAALMLVGEEPGDREDREGHPFVGPAGRLLDGILEDAGIPRSRVYLTNAVKHFKWEPRGKRRIHSKPNASEVQACRGWLDAEISAVRPRVIVCLGATAAHALLGRTFSITRERGDVHEIQGIKVLATYHPSALLRMLTIRRDYALARKEMLSDLRKAARLAKKQPARTRDPLMQ